MQGHVTGMQGHVTGMQGHVTGMQGHVTGMQGHMTGMQGHVTGMQGHVTGMQGAYVLTIRYHMTYSSIAEPCAILTGEEVLARWDDSSLWVRTLGRRSREDKS